VRVETLWTGAVTALDYRCDAGPADEAYSEMHERFSLSYVRRGSFGGSTRGRHYELVPGSSLIGFPGDEFVCTHDRLAGDECLSFQFSPALVETVGGEAAAWRAGAVPSLEELVVLGELAQKRVDGATALGIDETALMLATRFAALLGKAKR
jgi:hypothetical protein